MLYAGFDWADDQGLLLLDLKDLRAMLAWLGENAKSLRSAYGTISTASIGAIQHRLLVLEEQDAQRFFGEPALQLDDLMHTDFSGRGVVSLFDASRLIHQAPRLYAAFLLWLLADLFEQLPEAGDPPVPKLVMFFDEAHLFFFLGTPAADRKNRTGGPVDPIQRGWRIRYHPKSHGSSGKCSGTIGAQGSARLRAFTPRDQKVIRAVAAYFLRPTPRSTRLQP